MFDISKVLPILCYGSEMWGANMWSEIEIVQFMANFAKYNIKFGPAFREQGCPRSILDKFWIFLSIMYLFCNFSLFFDHREMKNQQEHEKVI